MFGSEVLDAAAFGAGAVILGAVLALLAEPIKLHFQHKHKLRQLRNMLYKEIGYNYFLLRLVLTSYDWPKYGGFHLERELKRLHFDCYNFARNDIVLYYQLSEAAEIDDVYRNVKRAYEDNNDNEHAITAAAIDIESKVWYNYLSKSLLLKLAPAARHDLKISVPRKRAAAKVSKKFLRQWRIRTLKTKMQQYQSIFRKFTARKPQPSQTENTQQQAEELIKQ